MKKHWGDSVSKMSKEELDVESAHMLYLRKVCSIHANDDLSLYTSTMAAILGVKRNVLGSDSQVMDRKDWIQALMDDPSSCQLQKWIFAWMYARTNYKKFVSNFKEPDEIFEDKFMRHYNLQYDVKSLMNMKKNSKTCIRLIYNVRARTWRDKMIAQIKEKLQISLSVTAPKETRGDNCNYRRERNTFFIGKIVNGTTIWKDVSKITVYRTILFVMYEIDCKY